MLLSFSIYYRSFILCIDVDYRFAFAVAEIVLGVVHKSCDFRLLYVDFCDWLYEITGISDGSHIPAVLQDFSRRMRKGWKSTWWTARDAPPIASSLFGSFCCYQCQFHLARYCVRSVNLVFTYLYELLSVFCPYNRGWFSINEKCSEQSFNKDLRYSDNFIMQ